MEATPDPREQANEIFADALELTQDQRAPFVERQCGENSGLRDSVMRLLSRFDKLGDFLDQPAVDFVGASTRELQLGVVLADRFRVVELIGRGGMGEVYRADDLTLGEPAALKIIRAEWRLDPGLMARFREEIRIARRIADPHVCKVFDVFTATLDGASVTFFSMEYLEGEPLSEVLKGKPKMEPDASLRIAEGIAAGLDAAHSQGVIHRDLKPANIMLLRDRPVIMDFGLAKSAERLAGSMTERGLLVGTPAYMAPEQFLEEPLTPATDVYAFGLILYEMITGTQALSSASLFRTAVLRLTSDGVPRGRIAADVPKSWERVLRRALARNPAKRYQSAGELARELRQGPGVVRLPSRRALMISAGAAAVSVSFFLGWRRLSEWGHLEAPTIMLMPIQTPGAAKEDAAAPTARAFDVQLEKGIQQSAYLRALSRQDLAQGWKLMAPDTNLPGELSERQAREIALRKGAAFLLRGELYRLGSSKWELKLKLERLGNSAENAKDSRSRDFNCENDSGLLSAAANALDWVRETAGEAREELAVRSRVPAEITTRDWQALRCYGVAEDAWTAHEQKTAEDNLREAIRLDTEFTLAYARLADIQMASRKSDDGLRNYETAARLAQQRNLTDREALRIRGMFALDTGQFAEAESVFARYAAAYPREGLPLFHEARAVESQGHVEAGLRIREEGLRREPDSYVFVITRAIRLLILGRIAEAQAECDRSARLNPRDWTDQLRAALALAHFDGKEVWNCVRRMKATGSPVFRSKALVLEASLHAEKGRWREAEGLLVEGLRYDREYLLPPEISLAKRKFLARMHLIQGRRLEAIASCREALAVQPGIRPRLEIGAILALAGDLEGAQACVPDGLPKGAPEHPPQSLHIEAAPQLKAWPVYWNPILHLWAEMALAGGRPKAAFELVSAAPPMASDQVWPDLLVRSAIAAGEGDIARVQLARLAANPASYWLVADTSPPGFLRDAVGRAGQAGLASTEMASLEKLLQQLN